MDATLWMQIEGMTLSLLTKWPQKTTQDVRLDASEISDKARTFAKKKEYNTDAKTDVIA
jgi:hypothetical protein